MRKLSNPLIQVADFETTVYDGQTETEVWASAIVQLFTEDVYIFHSIEDTYKYICALKRDMIIYYHNLKFDGNFWLSYFITKLKLKQAYASYENNGKTYYTWLDTEEMKAGTFKYSISDMGIWYTITLITEDNNMIEFRDSMKLLPFSVKKIGKSFKTKHKKLEMEYKGRRYAGCEITDEERKYIANDVLVVKEALEIMYEQKHNRLTIGSCCLAEFKQMMYSDYRLFFPDLTQVSCPFEGFKNADEYIRKSYHGGWCYLVKGKENKVFHNGLTLDVNSLYPSMMHNDSGNVYPIGKPTWFTGSVPKEVQDKQHYFFIHVKTKFHIKPNMLPTIQIKGNPLYRFNEWLETSDITLKDGTVIHDKYIVFGKEYDTRQDLYLTQTDYYLLHDHYNLIDYEEVDGCWFYSMHQLFDMYIDKYAKIKMESTGAIRELAKLFLNNLYGKLASGTDSSFKVAYERPDHAIGYTAIQENNKQAVYIPAGSAITSYARNFTIRTAQKNYYGKDKRGFIYADTDSIHCDLDISEVKGVPLDSVKFCHWKHESDWDKAIFVRQKTYIEHVVKENEQEIEKPYYNIKCAGMPQRCKDLLGVSMGDDIDLKETTEQEQEFLKTKRELTDFKQGLVVPSKLLPKLIAGGVVLTETTFEMR